MTGAEKIGSAGLLVSVLGLFVAVLSGLLSPFITSIVAIALLIAAWMGWVTARLLAKPRGHASYDRFFSRSNDVFVSYARHDGTNYALKLGSQLSDRALACFLDLYGVPPGKEIAPEVFRELHNSTILLLVVSPAAAISVHVREELEAALRAGKIIIPVSVGGSLQRSDMYPLVLGMSIADESMERFLSASPSPEVIERIVNAQGFVSRNKRVRRLLASTALSTVAVLSVGAGLAWYGIRDAGAQRTSAIVEREAAFRDRDAADRERQGSVNAAAEANRMRIAADAARDTTETERISAAASAEWSRRERPDYASLLAAEALRRNSADAQAYQTLQESGFVARKRTSLRSFPGWGVFGIASRAKGPLLYLLDAAKVARVYDLGGSVSPRDFPPGTSLTLNSSGTTVIEVTAGGRIGLRALDRPAATEHQLADVGSRYIRPIFSSDGNDAVLAVGEPGGPCEIHVFDRGGEEQRPATVFPVTSTISDVECQGGALAAGPAGSSFVVSTTGGAVELRRRGGGSTVILQARLEARPQDAVISADGEVIGVLWSDGLLSIVTAARQAPLGGVKQVQTLARHGPLTFSSDNRYLATIGDDTQGAGRIVQVWDTASAFESARLSASTRPKAVVFDPNGRTVHVGGIQDRRIGGGTLDMFRNGAVETFDLRALPLMPHPSLVNTLAFDKKGDRLLSRQVDANTLCVWTLTDTSPKCMDTGSAVADAGFGADGEVLTVGVDLNEAIQSSRIMSWDHIGANGAPKTIVDRSGLSGIAFGAAGNRIVGFASQNVVVLDARSGKQLTQKGIHGSGLQLATDALGRRVVGAVQRNSGNEGFFFETTSGSIHTNFPDTASFEISADGSRAASRDGRSQVTTWRLSPKGPERLAGFRDDQAFGSIGSMAISPDGKVVATNDADFTVRLWDSSTGKPVFSFSNPGLRVGFKVDAKIAFSPDGKWLATISENVIRLHPWRLSDLIEYACEHIVGRNMSSAEWVGFFPTTPYRKTCPSLP